jgi:putative transposase
LIVKPETVIGWHRLLSLLAMAISIARRSTENYSELRDLIVRLADENPDAETRLHYCRAKRGPVSAPHLRCGDPKRRWLAFLQNHREIIAAMDFFTVPTVTFRVLYCFFVIEHERRKILHCNVTQHPTVEWMCSKFRS